MFVTIYLIMSALSAIGLLMPNAYEEIYGKTYEALEGTDPDTRHLKATIGTIAGIVVASLAWPVSVIVAIVGIIKEK